MPPVVRNTFDWIGAWDSGTTYYVDNLVRFSGSAYICILAHTNQTPPNATYWELFVEKGDQGDPGTNGTNGTNGVDGADGADGIIASIVPGTGINVDNTDPANPVVSVAGVGTGDVVGPASATDNAIARYNTTTGKLIQDTSQVTISDAGAITAALGTITVSTPHSLTETWNDGAVTFIGLDIDVTATASATASRPFRVRVGGTVIAAASRTQLISAAGSVIAGNAPGLSFEGFTDTGIAANSDNIAFWESGTIALNLTTLGKEFRIPSDFAYAFSTATNNNSSADIIIRLTRESSGVMLIGTDAASPQSPMIKASDGLGTDRGGSTLYIGGGRSTGTGAPGKIIFRLGTVGGSSNATEQALADRMEFASVDQGFKLITAGAAVKGQVIKLAASQTANAFEVIDSTEATTYCSITASGMFIAPASTTGGASIRLPHGTAPTSPVDGDMWTTSAGGLYVRINGVTVGPLGTGGGGGVSDGDKGDITVSGSGATWTIDAGVISTYGRTLTVAADATAARIVLGVDVAGTDNSVNVTLAGTPTYITISGQTITRHTIVNADIDAAAAIADSKLDTIVSSGKVSNSATTATSANTNSAIVARDSSGNFSANEITANITTGNTGLHILDTNDSHDLILSPGSDLSADRTLTLTTGDSNRTLKFVSDGVVGETRSVTLVIDGGGSVITTGDKSFVTIPYDCTVTGWRVLADQSGSIVIDVKKVSYASYPGTPTSIAGSELPTLSSASKNEDTSLSTWTASITAGDILVFSVSSVSTVTKITLQLNVRLT